MDPRYVEVLQTVDGVELGCTQCTTIIFGERLLKSESKLLVFDLVRASLRHSCATVEKIQEIIKDAN